MTSQRGSDKRKGSAFTEMLSLFVHADYRLPILEVFTFLFVSCVFLFESVNDATRSAAFSYMTGTSGISIVLFIFMILIWKNIAYGLGGDFEKGVMQTFLTYPLSRGRILLARLLSSIGVAVAVLALAQFLVAFVISPAFVEAQLGTLVVGFVAVLATPLLATAVVLLVTLKTKVGGVPLLVGILFYFGLTIFSLVLLGIGYSQSSYAIVSCVFLLNPVLALQYTYSPQGAPYYGGPGAGATTWVPTSGQAFGFLAGNLILSLVLFALCVYLFTRRLET